MSSSGSSHISGRMTRRAAGSSFRLRSGQTGMPLPHRKVSRESATILRPNEGLARLLAHKLAPQRSGRAEHVDHAVERRAGCFRHRDDQRLEGRVVGTVHRFALRFMARSDRSWPKSI